MVSLVTWLKKGQNTRHLDSLVSEFLVSDPHYISGKQIAEGTFIIDFTLRGEKLIFL